MEMSMEGVQNAEPIKPKHSGFGVASFSISIAVGLLILVVFVIAGILQVSTPGGMDQHSIKNMVIGLSIIGLLLFDIIAAVFGIIGLFQRERKKLFAILGTIFSLLTVILVIALIIFGIMKVKGAI